MPVEFRCEKCGKMLKADVEPGSTVRCEHCKARIAIPAALATLPTPRVPPDVRPAVVPTPPPPPPPSQEEPALLDELDETSPAMEIMAKAMPWVFSLFLHVGILVLLGFIFIIVAPPKPEEPPISPDSMILAKTPGGTINPGSTSPLQTAAQAEQENEYVRDSSLARNEQKPNLLSVSGTASGGAINVGRSGGHGQGPKAEFMGQGSGAYNVVLVIDRSGSMLVTLRRVKDEMAKTISQMDESQYFSVIFFAENEPEEFSRGLVRATRANKKKAGQYLSTVEAMTSTDPIPALKRAFAVLSDARKRGSAIFLLTDGKFDDGKGVISAVKGLQGSKDGDIKVHTYLYCYPDPSNNVDEESVLKKIAELTGGSYKFVPVD